MKRTDYLIQFLACLYIILLPLAPSGKYEWATMGIFVLIGIIYLLELIFDAEARTNLKINFKNIIRESFTIVFIALVAIMLLSTFYAKDKFLSLKVSIRYVYYVYLYLIIRLRLNKEEFFSPLIKVFMGIVAIETFMGINDFFKSFHTYHSLIDMLNVARVEGTIAHPNSYGAFLILAIFPAIIIAIKGKGVNRIVFFILSLLVTFNIIVTFSRNAWLALGIGIILLVVLHNWKFVFLSVIPIGVFIAIPRLLLRITHFFDSDINSSRFKLFKVSQMVIKDNFLLGVGNSNFTEVYKDYVKIHPELQVVEAVTLPPHNSYLRVFTELGIVGVIVFLIMCWTIVRKLYTVSRNASGFLKHFYEGYWISVVCFFVMCGFDDLIYVPKVITVFIIFVSMAFCLNGVKEKKVAYTLG